uniref:Uncharacterized protein n=1 Tax=Panagrolaimus superbus TaxID=310955 RepID=A0A914Y5P2_9BILA
MGYPFPSKTLTLAHVKTGSVASFDANSMFTFGPRTYKRSREEESQVHDLLKSGHDKYTADVPNTAFYLIRGPTGCGKSTLTPIMILKAAPSKWVLIEEPSRLLVEHTSKNINDLTGSITAGYMHRYGNSVNLSNRATGSFVFTPGCGKVFLKD